MFNNLILLFEKGYTPAFNLAITIVVARTYGVEALGNLALVFAFSGLGQYLTSRGTDQNILVSYASCQSKQLNPVTLSEVNKRLMILLVILIVLSILYVLLSFFMMGDKAVFFGFLGLILGAMSACAIPNEMRLIVKQEFKLLAKLKYTSGLIAILIGWILISHSFLGEAGLVGTLFVEKIIYLTLTTVPLKASFNSVESSSRSNKIPKVNCHVLISAFAIFGYNRMDQVYIYGAFSSQELGTYFAAIKLFEVANLFMIAAIASKLHIMADQRRPHSTVVSIERRLLLLSGILIAFIAVSAPLILSIVFNIELESYVYIYILAAATLFGVIGTIKGAWVAKNNRFHFNTYFTIIGSIVAIGALFFYKPDSLIGVATIMAMGQLVVNVICPLMLRTEREYLISLITLNKK